MTILTTTDPKYQIIQEQEVAAFGTPTGYYIVKTVVIKLLRNHEQNQQPQPTGAKY